MSDPPADGSAPPLLAITLRRSTVLGRFYLAYGCVVSMILGIALSLTAASSFVAAFPVFLPIFGVVGSMGSLSVFTSDRLHGTLEYFLAYGVTPRRLFADFLLTTVALVSVVLAVAVGVGLGLYLGLGHPLTDPLVASLGLYAVPMTYACAAFATSVGIYWSALSSPRTGLSSPLGLTPFFGILPSVLVLLAVIVVALSGPAGATATSAVALGGVAITGAVALTLLAMSGRLLRPERFLSSS